MTALHQLPRRPRRVRRLAGLQPHGRPGSRGPLTRGAVRARYLRLLRAPLPARLRLPALVGRPVNVRRHALAQ